MNINDRVKAVRNQLDLTQIEFGSKTGISQGHLTSIENGKRTVTEKTLKVICATFDVNEEWLRTGDGEMFKQDESAVVSQLSREYGLDDLDRRIIESYLRLDATKRSIIKEYVRSIFKDQIGMEAADEINEEVESYRRELQQEKSSKMSPALPHSSENVG